MRKAIPLVVVSLAIAIGALTTFWLVDRDGAPSGAPTSTASSGTSEPQPIGVALFVTGRREYVTSIYGDGTTSICADMKRAFIHAVTEDRVVFSGVAEWGDHESLFEADFPCDGSPRVILDREITSLPKTGIECAGVSPSGRLVVDVWPGTPDRMGFRETATGWVRTPFEPVDCEWLDDDHLLLGRQSWREPVALDVGTGEISFFADLNLLDGVPSPTGDYVVVETHPGAAIVDVADGSRTPLPRVARGCSFFEHCIKWSPDGSLVMISHAGTPVTIADLTGTVVARTTRWGDWLTSSTLASTTRLEMTLEDLDGTTTPVDFPIPAKGYARIFLITPVSSPPVAPRLDMISTAELEFEKVGDLGIEIPMLPRSELRRCRHHCTVDGYHLAWQLNEERSCCIDGGPTLRFGVTPDDVSTVRDRLTEAADDRCRGDGASPDCFAAEVGTTMIGGRKAVSVGRLYWEWTDGALLVPHGDSTLVIWAAGAGMRDAPGYSYLFDALRFT